MKIVLLKMSTIGIMALIMLTPAITSASSSEATINLIGDEGFNANSRIFSTFRFSPGNIHVNQGAMVSFANIVTGDVHTISIVSASSLPTNLEQVFGCGAPGTVCAAIFAAHVPNGFGPGMQPNPPVIPFVNVPGNPGGFQMGEVQGNSLLIAPGQTVTLIVVAPSGSSFQYMCAIHPWMQGEIDVK